MWAFACAAAGIVLGRVIFADNWCWLAGAGACVFAACCVRGRWCALLLGAAMVLGFASWCRVRTGGESARAWESALGAAGEARIVEFEGRVVGEAARSERPRGALARFMSHELTWEMRVASERLIGDEGTVEARGELRVRGEGEVPAVGPGDRVRVRGLFRGLEGPSNPGARDWRPFSSQEGRVGSVFVPRGGAVKRIGEEGWSARVAFARWRSWLTKRARAVLDGPGEGRAIVRSLLLGEEEESSREVERSFTRLGLSHLLAISGFHLTVMAGVALALVRLTGDRGGWEGVIVAALVGVYMAIVPAEAPVVRSGLMVLALLASRGLGRRYDDLNVLAWVGVVLLAWRPMDLFSLGFQLSLGLTAALVWIVPRVNGRVFEPPLKGAIVVRPVTRIAGERLMKAVIATGVCWLLALPAIAYTMGTVSPWTVAATLPVAPVVLVLLWAGYATLLAGVVFPGLGEACSAAIEPIGSALVGMVRVLDGLPAGSMFVPRVSLAWALAATTGMVVWMGWGRAKSWVWWLIPGGLAAWLAVEVATARGLERDVAARVDVLAVGDGLCALVRSGDEVVAWGCGASWASAGVREIPAAARAVGAGRARIVIVSGVDINEFSALLDVVGPLGAREVVIGAGFEDVAEREPAGPHAYVLGQLHRRGVGVRIVRARTSVEVGGQALAIEPRRVTIDGREMDVLVGTWEVSTEGGARVIALAGEHAAALEGDVVIGPPPRWGGTGGAGRVVWSGRSPRTGPRTPAAAAIAAGGAWATEAHGAVRVEMGRDGEVRVSGIRNPDR